MLNFIIRRVLYSALILIGVLLLTFLLFRVAAGDPTAVLLGKNPKAQDIEELREMLAVDRPLIWGYWCRSEIYPTVIFDTERNVPGLKISGDAEYVDNCLRLSGGKIILERGFESRAESYRVSIKYRGKLLFAGESREAENIQVLNWDSPDLPEILEIEVPDTAEICEIRSFRRQRSPWDSQLLASITELISFHGEFPFVRMFNFGRTLQTHESIRRVLWRGVWPSLSLMLPIFFGELFFGIVLALISAALRGRWPDRLIMLLSVAGMSISYLVFIIFGQWYLAYYFNWFPVWGWGALRYLALPVLIGIVSGLGGGVRFYRTIFVNELNREYLRTAVAKGCSPLSVYCQHLLRNASIPLITRATTILPFLFTGSLLLESFFGIPGLGYTGYNALMNADLQMVKALVIVTAILFIAMNTLADVAYAWADPRVRLR